MKNSSCLPRDPTKVLSRMIGVFLVNAAACSLLFLAVPAAALTLIVDDLESDLIDLALDGNCDIGNGKCTLRAAMMEINGPFGETSNKIQFDLPPGAQPSF